MEHIYHSKIIILIMFIGVYYPTKNKLPVIIMEKMQFSLKDLLEKRKNVQWEKKLSIMNDVCLGLQYLHNRNPPIVHRDLTPNNILLCSHLRAKISDLGVAKVMHGTDTKTLTQNPGTNDFMPPESTATKPFYGLPLDIFSFGGVTLYICTQQWPELPPLISSDPSSGRRIILTELERRQQYLDQMFGVYADIKSLVISCLDDNPIKRPLVAEVLLEVDTVKNAYNEKMYCTVPTTGKQPSIRIPKNQEQTQPEQPMPQQPEQPMPQQPEQPMPKQPEQPMPHQPEQPIPQLQQVQAT